MGNYQFGVSNPPKNGQVKRVVDSPYTVKQEFPKSVMYQGTQVKVLGSKNLLKSRPNAPDITASLVLLPNQKQEVLLSGNLK